MKEVYCKWVSNNMKTLNSKWEVGIPKELPQRDDLQLRYSGLFHYFLHPLLAVLFKEKYGCYFYTKLYEVLPEGKIVKGHGRSGATKLTLVKELEIPEITLNQQIAFGIFCVKEVYSDKVFISWANKWLSGEDRSRQSAKAINVFIKNAKKHRCYDNGYKSNSLAIDAASYASSYYKPLYDSAAFYAAVYAEEQNNSSFDLISLAEKAMQIQ